MTRIRNYFLLFVLLSLIAFVYLSISFKSTLKVQNDTFSGNKKDFVSLQNGKFFIHDSAFYPLAINYIAWMHADKNGAWVCPSIDYYVNSEKKFLSKDSSLISLKADMALIKEMGFNTVRVVGIGEVNINEKTGEIRRLVKLENQKDSLILISNDFEPYFKELEQLFDIIDEAGLKIIFLIKADASVKFSEEYTIRLVSRFKNKSCILAYDFFNEPLYFEKSVRTKKEVFNITKRWAQIMKNYAPYQLSTIGLTGVREVFEWDPNILNVDFISLHPYEYEPEQVRNEIYWYNKYIKKPWLIGETAIPADNDSISYYEQSKFAHNTLYQAFNCGSIGYSWWQYKDVNWFKFHANYMGVVSREGETRTKNNFLIKGTPKPLVEEFKKFDSTIKKTTCLCLKNYYNYSSKYQYKISGRLIDNSGEPIKGGVILGWSNDWQSSYNTFSREDGSFELFGEFPFSHWMVSATEHDVAKGDISLKKNETYQATEIGTLTLSQLSFIKK